MITEILAHAKQEYPRESCGVVIVFKGRERYIPCKNIATERHNEFLIDPEDYANASDLGQITKIAHSHPKSNPSPSQNDLVSIEHTQLPWIICNPLTEQWTETKPTGYKAPLIGREYGYGVLDCYTLIRDYYGDLNIHLDDYDRSGDETTDAESYICGLTEQGFTKVAKPEIHDLVIMFGGKHGAIYVGNNLILQHCRNRLSSRDVYGGYWAKNTYGFYRHKDLTKPEN